MQIDAVEKDIDTTEMKWPDLMVHDWPVDEIFKGRLQTDNYILFIFIFIYINVLILIFTQNINSLLSMLITERN